jgi:hypothetical protein
MLSPAVFAQVNPQPQSTHAKSSMSPAVRAEVLRERAGEVGGDAVAVTVAERRLARVSLSMHEFVVRSIRVFFKSDAGV